MSSYPQPWALRFHGPLGDDSTGRQINPRKEVRAMTTTDHTDAVLAAPREACEVREELGVRFAFPDGLYNDCWLNDQAAINRAIAHPGVDMAATPLRRLVITTPPVSSTGEEKTGGR